MSDDSRPADDRGRERRPGAADRSVDVDPDNPDLLANRPVGEVRIPRVVVELAASLGADPEPIWRNELGGLTFRLGDRYVKWNPPGSDVDLLLERDRLAWLAGRHPVPAVLDSGSDGDGQWLVTAAVEGESAVADVWRERPRDAVRAIATGLRALHDGVAPDETLESWSAAAWSNQHPAELGERPEPSRLVVCHGDACAPNTLIAADGSWGAHVDVGALALADPWSDLAVASMSLDWNYGPGWQATFFADYGIEPDPARIDYYRRLWNVAS
ncbi:MAG: aminoglycoside 3'-phosphotransferase [Microbacteriaceae bacterium]